MNKKVATTLLAGTILLSSLSACADKGGASAGEVNSTPAETTGQKNAFGWEIPKETLKINAFNALQASPDERKKYDEKLRQYLLEKFNVDLTITVYDTDPEERLNLMLSSGDYPECIYSLSLQQAYKFIDQGKAIELSQFMGAEKTPAMTERYKDYAPMIQEEDGKLYQLLVQATKANPDKIILCADTAPMVRQDWYEEIGSPDISTPEAYYEAVKAMVAKHPTNAAGKNTYGLSFYDTKGTNIVPSFVSWWGGMYGLKQGWDIDADNNMTYWFNSDQGLKLIQYMNQFYRDGLLDPDGFVMPVEQWGEKGIEERYAAYIGPWFQPGFYISDHWLKLEGEAYPPLKRYVHYDVKDASVENSTYNPQNALSSRMILTDKCKNPADYMRWFEFENTTPGVKLMGYGIPNEPGSIWTIDEATGEYAFVPEMVDQITAEVPIFDFDPFMLLGGDCQMVITSTADMLEDGSNCWFNQTNKDKWKKLKDENMKDSFYNNTAFAAVYIEPSNPLIDTKQRCADIVMTGYANAITAKTPEECVAIYNKMRDDCNKAGAQDLEKFFTEGYKKNLTDWAK